MHGPTAGLLFAPLPLSMPKIHLKPILLTCGDVRVSYPHGGPTKTALVGPLLECQGSFRTVVFGPADLWSMSISPLGLAKH
jgi:hypothetical protein